MNWEERWESITQEMHTKRAGLLQEMIDKRISRSQAAMILGKATQSISNMVERYSLNWPRFQEVKGGGKGFQVEEYKSYARQGFTKMQTAQKMGVTWNAVDQMAHRHEIKFKDGRRKND